MRSSEDIKIYSQQIYRYQRNPIIYTILNVARDTNALTEVFSFFHFLGGGFGECAHVVGCGMCSQK